MRRITHALTGSALTLVLIAAGCKHAGVRQDSQSAPLPTESATATNKPPRTEAEFDGRKSADACIAVARELEKARRDQEAIALYERALEFNPAQKDIAHRLACLSARTGEHEAARTHFEDALRQSPRDPQLINDYGYFLFTRGEYKAAERQQRVAVKLAPRSRLFQSNLAMTLAAMLDYDESLEIFERLVGPAAGRSNLAVLMTRNGDTDRAEKMVQDAQVIDPSIEQTEVVAEWLTGSTREHERGSGILPASLTTSTEDHRQ